MKNNSVNVMTIASILAAIQPAGNEQKSLVEIDGRRLRPKTLYIAGNAADLSGNSSNALLPSQAKDPGITNIQNAMLDKGMHFLATSVRVLFDTTTADPKSAIWAGTAPQGFKNGELKIGQDGQPVLFEASGTDVTNFKASTGNDDDFRTFESPFLLLPQKTITVQHSVVAGVALPATCSYKIEIRGFEIVEV